MMLTNIKKITLLIFIPKSPKKKSKNEDFQKISKIHDFHFPSYIHTQTYTPTKLDISYIHTQTYSDILRHTQTYIPRQSDISCIRTQTYKPKQLDISCIRCKI